VIFVDTSAWFAASVPTDPNHRQADALLATTNPRSLITTDYILDESMTLFRMRGESQRAYELGRRILEERICSLVWVERTDVLKAWTTFESFRDKNWSFTDCVTRAVMERMNLVDAFTFDRHFREFGNVTVVP
jgi:uncharacterized protein